MLEEITLVLEQELFTKNECLQIDSKLHFHESTLEVALIILYLEFSLICYYQSALPELVLTNTQVLLDDISDWSV